MYFITLQDQYTHFAVQYGLCHQDKLGILNCALPTHSHLVPF